MCRIERDVKSESCCLEKASVGNVQLIYILGGSELIGRCTIPLSTLQAISLAVPKSTTPRRYMLN